MAACYLLAVSIWRMNNYMGSLAIESLTKSQVPTMIGVVAIAIPAAITPVTYCNLQTRGYDVAFQNDLRNFLLPLNCRTSPLIRFGAVVE